MVQIALNASRTKNTFYQAKHNQLRFRLGSYNKATVAIANRMARTLYHIIKDTDERYSDLGCNRADTREMQKRRLLKKLDLLGYDVAVTEKAG